MDRKDIKMYILHRENMCILELLGADSDTLERLERIWNINEGQDTGNSNEIGINKD